MIDETKFKEYYDKYDSTWSTDKNEAEQAVKEWKTYYDKITDDSFDLDCWIKKEDGTSSLPGGYLPNFIDQMSAFGHARIGNYTYVMIYYDTSDKSKKNKKGENHSNQYYNGYAEKKKQYSANIKDIEDPFNNNIKELLKKICRAGSLEALEDIKEFNDVHQSDNINEIKFSARQIIRKMVVLMSLQDSFNNDTTTSTEQKDYANKLLWIYDEAKLNKLLKLFFKNKDEISKLLNNNNNNGEPASQTGNEVSGDNELSDDDVNDFSFFEKSYAIHERCSGWLGNNGFDLANESKLNSFLWELANSNFDELENPNCPNIIFHGAPGTGKTHDVLNSLKLLEMIGENFGGYEYCQFHPSYSYQDFIEGIKPVGFNQNGNLNLQVVNGTFKQFCIKVKTKNEENGNINKQYYFVVDEINRGNLSNIFGETFTLLEKDYRDDDFNKSYKDKSKLVKTPLSSVIAKLDNKTGLCYKEIDDEVYFGIPKNIHFIGIMNDVDKSIDTFDLALRRRFKWIAKYCDYDVIENNIKSKYKKISDDELNNYIESCKALNNYICGSEEGLRLSKSYEIGHSFFMKISEFLGNSSTKIIDANKRKLFDNYIEPTIKEYIREMAEENEIEAKLAEAKTAFGI